MPLARLSMRDGVATAIVAGAGALYWWHLASPGVAFVGSNRWLGLTLFVLGVTACPVGGRASATMRYSRVMSGGAAAAFVLTIVTLVTGGEFALASVAGVVGAMWLITTVRHALGTQPRGTTEPRPPSQATGATGS